MNKTLIALAVTAIFASGAALAQTTQTNGNGNDGTNTSTNTTTNTTNNTPTDNTKNITKTDTDTKNIRRPIRIRGPHEDQHAHVHPYDGPDRQSDGYGWRGRRGWRSDEWRRDRWRGNRRGGVKHRQHQPDGRQRQWRKFVAVDL